MTRVILLTFGFMSWAWYEMSGGAEFQPGDNGITVLARVEQKTLPEPQEQIAVTRADDGGSLTAVAGARVTADLVSASAPIQPVQPEAEPQKIAALIDASVRSDVSPEPAAVVLEAVSIDYRKVTGNRVNLRSGPGTSFGVVTRLVRDDEVEILADVGDGWVKLRSLNGNDIGWMSADFLRPTN